MGIVPRKLVDGSTVYWLTFTWQGKRVWEKSGKVARDAQRLDEQRRREVALGTYVPPTERDATTVGQWIGAWVEKRATRNADDEESHVRRLVLARSWFSSLALNELRPKHLLRLVDELKATVSEATGKPLSSKSVANVYGTIRTALRDARFAELLAVDPCVLPRGTFKRRGRGALRAPYSAEEVAALVSDPKIAPDFRVWNALAFFTGMREGEVCGRRWRDWNRNAAPLTALTVETQYDDRPLKTEDTKGDQPRKIPVHPELERVLAWWWSEGWAATYGREPTSTDWIVPKKRGVGAIVEPHTKSTAYKAWRRSCRLAGVENKSLHSTRHTFVSLARRGGARKDVLEQITHNATGDIVDEYTTWDWAPLCEAVACFRCAPVDQGAQVFDIFVEAPGIEEGAGRAVPRNYRRHGDRGSTDSADDSPGGTPPEANRDARNRAAMHRAKDLALAGDAVGCLAELHRSARLLGLESAPRLRRVR